MKEESSMSNEKLFINGKIFTANDEKPYASACIVKDGIISWIGETEEVPYDVKNVSDLNGKRVIPGIIDAHLHPLFLASFKSGISCIAPTIHSIEELIINIQEKRSEQKDSEWIEGWGYDEGKLTEGRAPNRYDLDKGTTDVPVVMMRTCSHIISVNSKALDMAGIDEHTEDVPGGQIDRDENGIPTGILRENARYLVLDLKTPMTQSEYAEQIVALSEDLLSYGITGISEMMAVKDPVNYLDIYRDAAQKGMKQRIVMFFKWEDFQKLTITPDMVDPKEQAFIGGIKLFADGSISGLTAWVEEPYAIGEEAYGISITSREKLREACAAAKENGIQLAVHAMGEQAILQVIDSLEDQENWMENTSSIRIEHASFPTKRAMDVAAVKQIGFLPQPIFLFAEIETYINNLGKERTERSYPIKTMLNKGIPVALSSDAPATSWSDPINPFTGIQSAVTRRAYNGTDTGRNERISVETAIKLYTRGAQRMSNFPNVGQLVEGYEADFVVLDQDIFEVDAQKIRDTKVEATYIHGEVVYQRK